jgi:hypothetical protein
VKRRVELLDDYGNHITTVDAPAHTEGFEGADFSGLCAPGLRGTLRFQNLRGANLYWAMLQGQTRADATWRALTFAARICATHFSWGRTCAMLILVETTLEALLRYGVRISPTLF